ncbi:protein SCO1/2 [Pontibacter ummariensis]|uniref:Protein SCO1/2 n=1 Tax=Pontibacter ummariensis TaxID=1610492 RepID=A0A239KW72_9BACT|nr:SCO family protein [Pontibacter ummariensis]PRY04944.1 protein SCO1/2 [Pontibacter ummariensis]SNT22285.1 protein SCO1/2 [Pontibacter ummariensis]
MSKVKALILGTLLLVPILIFAFVSLFGEHHFSLKTYFPKTDESGEVVFSTAGDTVFHQVPDFQLTSQKGETFTAEDLSGKIYVADFFFATCPGICKKMSSQLVRVQEAFENYPEVKIVSITVNPEHDSVEVLQNYAAQYGAKEDKWYFLTGERDSIYQLAKKGFYLPVQQVEGQQDFIHSEKFMLVDKDRNVRGIYEGTDPADVDRLVTEIRVLLDEYSKSE